MAGDGTRIAGTKALGPDRQLLPFPGDAPLTGRFEIYSEDGMTLLGTSAAQTIQRGECYSLQ